MGTFRIPSSAIRVGFDIAAAGVIPPSFVQGCVSYAEDLGEPIGSQTLKDLRAELWDRMLAGEGKQVVNTNVNGRAFTFQVTMTVEEMFGAIGEAIREVTGASANVTRATFTDIAR